MKHSAAARAKAAADVRALVRLAADKRNNSVEESRTAAWKACQKIAEYGLEVVATPAAADPEAPSPAPRSWHRPTRQETKRQPGVTRFVAVLADGRAFLWEFEQGFGPCRLRPGQQIHRCFGHCGRRALLHLGEEAMVSLYAAMQAMGWRRAGTSPSSDCYVCGECASH